MTQRTSSISGFSDGGMFATLVIPKNASIKDVAEASSADLVKGSHKLRTLSDSELMALLLSHVTGKRSDEVVDCAIVNCGSFATMLSTPSFRLLELPGLTAHGVAAIKLIHAAAIRLFRAAVMDQPSLDDLKKLTRYLTAALSRENVEHLRILFLDSDGRLRADEAQSRGTVNHAPVYPREVVRRALELKTEFLILVHNHPSGDPTPSQDDIVMTQQIEDAAAFLNLKVWDHIIIGNGSWFSFRKEGLLQNVPSERIELYRKHMA
jgi:DNA repair protein RadC